MASQPLALQPPQTWPRPWTESEFEGRGRLFAPEPRQRMPTQRQLKALGDEGREPVVFERHERPDAQLAHDRVDLPRIAAHEVRERDRFRHPDGPGREEALEREEIPG